MELMENERLGLSCSRKTCRSRRLAQTSHQPLSKWGSISRRPWCLTPIFSAHSLCVCVCVCARSLQCANMNDQRRYRPAWEASLAFHGSRRGYGVAAMQLPLWLAGATHEAQRVGDATLATLPAVQMFAIHMGDASPLIQRERPRPLFQTWAKFLFQIIVNY